MKDFSYMSSKLSFYKTYKICTTEKYVWTHNAVSTFEKSYANKFVLSLR